MLEVATNPGDLVLDSFLGSGTTAAVAHKMGRRYIGIELGEHAVTHCVPRLRKVIEGERAASRPRWGGRAAAGSASTGWASRFSTSRADQPGDPFPASGRARLVRGDAHAVT